ncbi:hypothetical protein R1flu_023765 [Riccia fluitans]|uniref:Uncharacterized protein n=1 Tax=Riccia fluitans TaxID=41844 RepID=A0ABD1XX14_9MARC
MCAGGGRKREEGRPIHHNDPVHGKTLADPAVERAGQSGKGGRRGQSFTRTAAAEERWRRGGRGEGTRGKVGQGYGMCRKGTNRTERGSSFELTWGSFVHLNRERQCQEAEKRGNSKKYEAVLPARPVSLAALIKIYTVDSGGLSTSAADDLLSLSSAQLHFGSPSISSIPQLAFLFTKVADLPLVALLVS